MRGISRVIATVLLTAAAAVPAGLAHADTSTGSFAVHIVDATGKPLSGVCAGATRADYSYQLPVATAHTDSSGNATLTVPAGKYFVGAAQCTAATTGPAPRYYGGDDRIVTGTTETLSAGQSTSLGTLQLLNLGSISGVLKDDLGRTYSDACIDEADLTTPYYGQRIGPFEVPYYVAANGSFSLAGVYPRAHDVRFGDCRVAYRFGSARPSAAFPETTYSAANNGALLTVGSGQAVTGVHLAVPAGGKITGRVVDDTGAPVQDGKLCVAQSFNNDPHDGIIQSAPVAADGTFTLSRVLPGPQSAVVTDCGGLESSDADYVLLGTASATVVNDKVSTVSIAAPRTGKVTGRVVGVDGRAVAGATVFLSVSGGSGGDSPPVYVNTTATTASDGSYTLGGLVPGDSFNVLVQDSTRGAYAPAYVGGSATTSGATVFTAGSGVTVSGGTLTMSTPAATITGAMQYASGTRLVVSLVELYVAPNGGANVVFNKNGSFTIKGLAAFSDADLFVQSYDAKTDREIDGDAQVSTVAGHTTVVYLRPES